MPQTTPSAERILNAPGGAGVGNPASAYLPVILILLLVLLAAYLTTRFIGGRSRAFARGKYLRVKENLFLGRDKSVMLLESGKEYYVIGVTNQQMQLLGTIPKADLTVLPEESASSLEGLRGTLGKLYQNAKGAKNAPEDLRKAQAAYREANPEAGHGRGVLRVLRKPAADAPAQRDFAQDLQDAGERMRQQDEPPEVIVDISTPVETGGERMGDALQRKEDEIDRMMQSIEQRTQQLRQRRGKDSQDEDS